MRHDATNTTPTNVLNTNMKFSKARVHKSWGSGHGCD